MKKIKLTNFGGSFIGTLRCILTFLIDEKDQPYLIFEKLPSDGETVSGTLEYPITGRQSLPKIKVSIHQNNDGKSFRIISEDGNADLFFNTTKDFEDCN